MSSEASSSGSHVTIKSPAGGACSEPRRNLYHAMILREKLLALEAEKRKPNVRVRRMLERCSDSSKNVIHSIAHCVDAKKTRVRELWDFHKDVAEAPAFTGDFKTSGLYAIALENSSTKNLRTRLMEKRRRSQNSVDSDDEPVGHDTPGFLRRVGPTCASSDTTVAFANLNVSSTVSPASNSPAPMHPVQATFHPGYGWELSPSVSFCSASSRASSPSAQVDLALFPICHQAPRRGCMRGPKTRPEEEALLASPRPERSPPVSSDSVVFVEGSRIRTTRMLSLSYSNGDDEVEELTREHENRRRRRSTVICQWGEGVDEIIPGPKIRKRERARSLRRRFMGSVAH